jgi:hypothetical protein
MRMSLAALPQPLGRVAILLLGRLCLSELTQSAITIICLPPVIL